MPLPSRAVVGLFAGALVASGMLLSGPPAQAASSITIWADPVHAPVLTTLLADGIDGVPVTVVTKDLAAIRTELALATPDIAPDVVWADQAWSGELAASGTIVPVVPGKAARASIPPNLLSGFQVGAVRYGLPVQVSNVALITNSTLVTTQPSTFAELSSMALALKKAKKAKVQFAVAQGEGSDGVSMYPMFSGLGGYLFGRDAAGSVDPKDVGVANPVFLKNSVQVDAWNSSRLIKSALTVEQARDAFVTGKSAFWVAGPEELGTILTLPFQYRITRVPPMLATVKAVPLLRIQGAMLTSFAKGHGVDAAARKIVTRRLATVPAQKALAAASGWIPANVKAAAGANDRLRAIAAAGVDGVPFPNVPQSAALWGPYGTAWRVSTSGASATPASSAFSIAQKAIKTSIG